MKTDFQKIFKYQEKAGWCGPAVIQMALLAAGIKKTQKAIAKDVYKSWWGTNQAIMYSYLSRYFKKLDFKEGAKISDLKHHLDRKHLVIVNWWDDYDSKPNEDCGHYSLVFDYNEKTKMLTLGDPSSDGGIWKISVRDFEARWYDSLDQRGKKWVEGWFLWVDTKIEQVTILFRH